MEDQLYIISSDDDKALKEWYCDALDAIVYHNLATRRRLLKVYKDKVSAAKLTLDRSKNKGEAKITYDKVTAEAKAQYKTDMLVGKEKRLATVDRQIEQAKKIYHAAWLRLAIPLGS